MSNGLRYSLRLKRSAEKELDHLPAPVFDRIAEAILQLEADPRPQGSRKLRGTEGYRVRVGSYRILYTIDDDTRSVEIIAVGHRRDIYG
ncbi:MAG TPA: type II toxin-antitoxin system RelE/ParE family toxin [Planctomycetaceae bacterium]|nr:type II toxin-antitoxin system RelE/ParE family toxin [Planctomycetaceae bacterium]